MSYSNNSVKWLSARRIQLAKRITQAEGKLKFAVRRQHRKMAHSALGTIFDNSAKFNKLDSDIAALQLELNALQLELNEVEVIPKPALVSSPVKTESLANDAWLQSIMAIPVPVVPLQPNTKGVYYRLYFDTNKICLGGLTHKSQAWVYSKTDYSSSELVWLPDNYNPQGKHLNELKLIPRPLPPKITAIEGVDFTSKQMQQYKECAGDLLTMYYCDKYCDSWNLTKKRDLNRLVDKSIILSKCTEQGFWTVANDPKTIYTLSCNLESRKLAHRGRPRKNNVSIPTDKGHETKPAKVKSTIPKTHTIWTGTVQGVQMVDGKSFDPSFGKYDGIGSSTYLKRLRVELKTNTGEIVQFWTPNTECRVTCPSGAGIAITTVQSTDWIKGKPSENEKQLGDSPVATFKVGDYITVSGKIKTVWRGITVINWVRLQEVIPQVLSKDNCPVKTVLPIPKKKVVITPYQGKQLSIV